MPDDGGPFEVDAGRPFVPRDEADDARPPDAELGEGSWASPAAEAPPIGVLAEPEFELVPEATVRSLLQAQGSLLHATVAVDKSSDEWVWLQHELDTIAPPLTRIVNRYPVLQRAAIAGDPIAVAVAMGAYGRRSIEQRAIDQAALAAYADAQPTHDVAFHYAPDAAGGERGRQVGDDELDGMAPVERPPEG